MAVFSLEVERGCKIAKVTVEIFDVTMVKICLLDELDHFIRGVGDINVTSPDKVKEVFFVCFSPLLCFYFWLGWHWGGSGVAEIGGVCAVVVGGDCGGVVWK